MGCGVCVVSYLIRALLVPNLGRSQGLKVEHALFWDLTSDDIATEHELRAGEGKRSA